MLKRQLGLKEGIALGVGSIMGSGILFLPSLSYSLAGPNVLVSWLATTLLCVPLLFIFMDMVKRVPTERGLEGYISLGLGDRIGSSIPLLFLGTVGIGMPSAALIAGAYVKNFAGASMAVGPITAGVLLVVAVLTNLMGVKTGSNFQKLVSFALFALGAILFLLTFADAAPLYKNLTPTWEIDPILKGGVVAFWAYAGFENMTFTAGEFKNPKRDLILSILIALILCAVLYVGLTANFAALIPIDQIDKTTGLYQLSSVIRPASLSGLLVTLFALGAVIINLTSWSWGISRLIYASAGMGHLPSYFHTLSTTGVPKRALILLLSIFLFVVGLQVVNPQILETALVVVSTNFLFLYFLAAAAFVLVAETLLKKLLGLALLIAIGFALGSSKWLLLYPLGIVIMAVILSRIRQSRRQA